MKGHNFLTRLGFAWAGLRMAWGKEKSLRTHAMAAMAVVAILLWTHSPAYWWAVMALTIGLVISTELINTSVETLADHLHPQRHEGIKVAKDVAAGAVLIASVVALVVAASFVLDQMLPS